MIKLLLLLENFYLNVGIKKPPMNASLVSELEMIFLLLLSHEAGIENINSKVMIQIKINWLTKCHDAICNDKIIRGLCVVFNCKH